MNESIVKARVMRIICRFRCTTAAAAETVVVTLFLPRRLFIMTLINMVTNIYFLVNFARYFVFNKNNNYPDRIGNVSTLAWNLDVIYIKTREKKRAEKILNKQINIFLLDAPCS